MEKVFSVLERIWRLTRDGLNEVMVELRLLLQPNDDLDEIYNDLVINHGRNVNVCTDVYIVSTEHPMSVPQRYALTHTHVQLLKTQPRATLNNPENFPKSDFGV